MIVSGFATDFGSKSTHDLQRSRRAQPLDPRQSHQPPPPTSPADSTASFMIVMAFVRISATKPITIMKSEPARPPAAGDQTPADARQAADLEQRGGELTPGDRHLGIVIAQDR